MTLHGIGLGPGEADLLTVRGKRVLETADVVYSPGRLSRSVAVEHVPDERIGDLDFPMTRDEEELRRAWREAAAAIAPRARDGTAAFVTLGDPNVYSTFGHLRRTLAAFHPDVGIEIVPGVSAVTAFATALGVEIESGTSLALREAARGAAPTGPDRMILFKVTDAPTTHEGLREAGYDVVYGRRLFMEQGETIVTDDPSEIAERDYYTLAYAEKRDLDTAPATAAFEEAESTGDSNPRSGTEASDDEPNEPDRTAADDRAGATDGPIGNDGPTDSDGAGSVAVAECAEGEGCGDETPEVHSR